MSLTVKEVTLNFSHPVHGLASKLFKALELDGDHSGFGFATLALAEAYCDAFNSDDHTRRVDLENELLEDLGYDVGDENECFEARLHVTHFMNKARRLGATSRYELAASRAGAR